MKNKNNRKRKQKEKTIDIAKTKKEATFLIITGLVETNGDRCIC